MHRLVPPHVCHVPAFPVLSYPVKVETHYADPQLVGIVTRFYYDDYITFQIPLPPFARRALGELAARGDPYAMPTKQLDVLDTIRGSGIAVPKEK